ncbi:MAG: glycosyltransferase [Pseudomonadota bacterium]
MAEARVLLDLTRSLRRLSVQRASGIDRVEHAYLNRAIARDGRFLIALGGTHYLLGSDGARALKRLIAGEDGVLDLKAQLRPDRNRRLRMGESLVRKWAIAEGRVADLAQGHDVYLNVGHTNLDVSVMEGLSGLTRLVMLHDLIPLEHPEFARPQGAAQMRERLKAACLAEHLIVNSEDTGGRVLRAAGELGLAAPAWTKLALGIDLPPRPDVKAGDHFVYLSTIEPRKNHALLLDIWRPDWPELHFIGRRGWENREVFRRLDQAPANIREESDLPDAEVWRRLASAKALLFPSYVEGYGLPLAEALALGTPVIASDLPAFREIAGEVPDYLAPDDHAGWARMIGDYIADGPARDAQIARLAGWAPPGWDGHFSGLDGLLRDLLPQRV